MEEQIDQSSNFTTCYYCNICKTKPDQLSHHKAHLKTQKHIFQKNSFKQCIEKHYQWPHLSREKCMQMFENEVGLIWNKENRDEFLKWRLDTQICLLKLYPNVIYPENISALCCKENWHKDIENIEKISIAFIESNESVKTFVEQKSFNKIINKNKLIDEPFTIFDAVKNSSEYDIALLLFKRLHQSYSCKCFLGKGVWIDKNDSTINSDVIYSKILTYISTTIKDEFIEQYDDMCEDVLLELDDNIVIILNMPKLKNLINLLTKDKFVKGIMREAKELFYDN